MDSQIYNAVAIVLVVLFGGVVFRIYRKFFTLPTVFVYRGKELKDNTAALSGAKRSTLVPGQPIPSITLYEMLKTAFFSGKGGQQATIEQHCRLGAIHCTPSLLSKAALSVGDAEAARKIMVSSVEHFIKADVDIMPAKAVHFLGAKNVVFANGEQWKTQRTSLNPSFYDLSRYMSIFHKTTLEAFDAIEKERLSRPDSSIVQHDLLMKLTLDVLGRSVFHHEFGCLSGKSSEELNAYLYGFNHLATLWDVLIPNFHKVPTAGNKKFYAETAIMHGLLDKMLAQAKEKLKRMEETHQSQGELNILDQMVQSGLSDQELKDNAMILFLAGHETSANALSFVMGRLANNPDVQQRLYDAIVREIGEDGTQDAEKLGSCQYIDWTIKEALRMNGPVAKLPARRLTSDEEVNGVFIPKGSLASVSIAALHYNTEYWKEPETFRPERFSPEESKGRPSMAWMPFGAGKRVCLGMQFAMLEMKCFLSALMLRYKIEPAEGYTVVRPKPRMGIQSIEPGFRVRLIPRK